MKIKLKNVRLSFPSLFAKATFRGKETKFEATFLLNKETNKDAIAQIKKAIAEKIKNEFKGSKIAADKICLKDGDECEYTGYENSLYIRASSSTQPLLINRDLTHMDSSSGKFYAGARVNAHIEIWAQNNDFAKRINAQLLGVQFFENDESFSDIPTSTVEDFEFFGDDAEELNEF